MKQNVLDILLANIGFIAKPYGFDGEIILALPTGEEEDFPGIKFLFVEFDGKPVPFLIETIRTHRNDVIVKLEDINSEAEAKKLTGKKIFVEEELEAAVAGDGVNWNSLVGYTVVEKT